MPAACPWPSLSHHLTAYTPQAAPRQDEVLYASKLDDFDVFVSRDKYPQLINMVPASASAAPCTAAPASAAAPGGNGASGSQQQQQQQPHHQTGTATPVLCHPPKLLLLDDVPHAADAEARKRVTLMLLDLAATARWAGLHGRGGEGLPGLAGWRDTSGESWGIFGRAPGCRCC